MWGLTLIRGSDDNWDLEQHIDTLYIYFLPLKYMHMMIYLPNH